MKEAVIKIYENPPEYDHDDVRWEVDGESLGFGYRGKKDGKFHITKCPKCKKENYALAISEGSCAFCGFNPN